MRDVANRQRSKLLDRLLVRADASTLVTDWRADAFRVIAPHVETTPAVGAVALFAELGAVAGSCVFIATPVHYLAEMSNVRLSAGGILSLSHAEADALASDFNRVWNDAGIRLLAGPSADLFCICDRPLAATTHDPEDVLERHIETYLPTGTDAPRLRQLMSEIEMWLFEHAVNEQRIARAQPAVNGLWLWGGGATLESLPPVQGWTAGDDVFFRAFPLRAGGSSRLGEAPDAGTSIGGGVIVLAEMPGTDAWSLVESHWLRPALAELRSGRIARVELSAGERCFSLGPRWRWRFWRRHRPWWESFA